MGLFTVTELIRLRLDKHEQPEQKEELSSGDSLKLDLYFWLQALVAALVLLILVFTFVGRIIGVSGSSMVPTLHERGHAAPPEYRIHPQAGGRGGAHQGV